MSHVSYFAFEWSAYIHCRHGGVFSISRFAHNLTQRISNKSLVVDFRDCESLTVLLDQELLYWTRSPVFRPDLSIVEINVDNVDQVLRLQERSLVIRDTETISTLM